MAFIDRFSHLDGIIQSAIRAPNVEQLNEWLAFQDSTWEVLPMTGDDEFRDNLAFEPFDYLYNESDQSFHLKPAGVWLSSAGNTIEPDITTNLSWTVTGTLAPDFSQPTSNNASIYRFVDISTGQRVGSSTPLDNGIGSLVSSGTLASGIANQITFNPNTTPGIYRFFINNDHNLWRETDFDLTVSGATNSPVMSGTQVGTWNLQVNEDASPDTWTITRGTSHEYTANNNLFGLDLESGEIVLSSGGRIVTKNKFGTEVFVDLMAEDNSLDFQTVGANSSINIAARGEDSAVNILAESGTVNIDAVISDVNITATGTNRKINIAALGTGSSIDISADGSSSSVDLNAVTGDINITAAGNSRNVNLDAAGDNSAVVIEATGDSSSVSMRAFGTDTNATIEADDMLLIPTDTLNISSAGADPQVNFETTVTVNLEGTTNATGVFEAKLATRSLGLPQRTDTQLDNENPGAAGKGRIAWDSTDDRLEFWDGTEWLEIAGFGTSSFFIPDGTEALPGLAFQSDNATGIYRAASNHMGLSIGGNVALTLFNTGGRDRVFIDTGAVFAVSSFNDAGKDALLPAGNGELIINSTSGTLNYGWDSVYNQVANVDFVTSISGHLQSEITASGGLTAVVEDTSPELGGALDCGNFFVTNAGRFRSKSPGFASSAAFSFDDESQTGMYRKGAGVLAFTGNNSEVLTVSGASTATPGIGVNGDVTATGTAFAHDLDISNVGSFGERLRLVNNADADADFHINSGATATQQSRIFFTDQSNAKWIVYKTSANNFAVFDFVQSHNVLVINSHADNANAITIDNGAVAIASTLTAPTGTFANSLTVSGVPVATEGVGATAGSIKLITETFAL